MKKSISKFKTYKEEAQFWDKQPDWTEFFDMSVNQAQNTSISTDKEEVFTMRLPKFFKTKLTSLANDMGVGASTLARMWVVEKIKSLPNT
jgi:predicted DNA-binding protein (UPF0251 family)